MRNLATALLLVSVLSLAPAQTNLTGGNITKDSVWTLAGSPYVISGTINVNSGFTLTVDSGVVVRFQGGGTNLVMYGNLTARQAIFTSSKDTGGTPLKGDWGSIYLNASTDTLRLDSCIVKFSTYGVYGPNFSAVYLNGCSFLNSNSQGLYLSGPTVTMNGCNVTSSNSHGIYITNANTVALTGCIVGTSNGTGIYVSGTTVSLTNCAVSNSNGTGIQVNNATTTNVLNSTVSGSSSGQGMWLGSTNITVDGCNVSNSSSHGIFVDHGTTATVRKTTVTNSNGEGIWLGSASHISAFVDSCTVTTATGNGIRLYGGADSVHATSVSDYVYSGIYVPSGSASIVNCSITDPTKATPNPNTQFPIGLYFESGTAVNLVNSSITYTQWPIWYQGQCALVFDGTNTYANNTHMGIYINFGGTNADFVLDTVALPYVFPADFTVNSGNVMTIASTDVLKFAYGHLFVNGGLKAIASPGQSIFFTSYKDDNLPIPNSDTNADGSGTAPHQSDWYGVVFNDLSVDSSCVMRRCSVTFAGAGSTGAVSMYNASPTVDSCSLANNYFGAFMQYVSNPVFTNNTIGSSQLVPIAMAFTANPVFQNNVFSNSDNTYDALGLLGGALTANAVLPIRAVLRNNTKSALGALGIDTISNVTYLMLDQVTIPVGMTLTINKGVVIKGYQYWDRFTVQGKLVANATPDSMIVMTSVSDDNFGHPNDTNKNGNATAPSRGDWSGIVFESGSDSTSILNNCQIHYGSLYYSPYYFNGIYLYSGEITTINNANPTISNCILNQGGYGVYAYGSSKPIITNTKIINAQYTPIAMSVNADPFFSADSFVNPGYVALGIIGENLGASGRVRQRTVSGFTNITYVLLGDLNINSGTNVIIDPGVVIKSGGPGFYVSGSLHAKGTIAAGNIVFTSLKDDNFGNPFDTNRDGNSSQPNAGDWSTLRFLGTSVDSLCLIDSCQVNYAGNSSWGGVTCTDAATTISNSTIFKSANFGLRCENSSTPNVVNVTFNGCSRDPIAMSLQSNPTFTNITFSANGSKGIRILDNTLSSNATLNQRSLAGIPNIAYIIDNLTINSGAILTIAPGVVIKFSNYYNGIGVNGGLVANGTEAQHIIFTSIADDSNGGDTNNDGNGSSPGKGNWASIDFGASSADTINSLRNCEFRYGGGNNYSNENGIVRAYNTKFLMDSCVVTQSYNSGIGVFGSGHPTVSNTQINNVSLTPVTISMFSNPVFTNMSALNVGYMAIGIKPETYSITATIPVRDFAGYTNITYLMYGTVTINSGTTITVPAGVVFKDGYWVVNGALATNGTPAQKVVFTDSRDDSFGNPGDTNQDGMASSPSIQGNSRVAFNDVSIDSASNLQNTVFRFTDGGVWLGQASPHLLNCTFERDNWGLYLTGVSNPSVDSCKFDNLTYAPMRISLVSYPSSTNGDSISGTTFRAIGVLEGEILVQNVTLMSRTFAGIKNIPYLFGNYSVANNSVLTVNPGLILKFFPLTGMTIRNGLLVNGKAQTDSAVVFTDMRDDTYGGDTNADSSMTNPTAYSGYPFYWYPGWYGINFTSEALPPNCQVQHAIFRYAGLYNNGTALTTSSASPTITYTSFNHNNNAIVATGSSNPIIHYCDFVQNSGWGVNNSGQAFTIDATSNWWGSNTGPTISSNPGGTGEPVSTFVNYSPFLNSGSTNPLSGDVSLNGAVQAFDASLILQWVADPVTYPLDTLQQQVADVSANGTITAFDASLILQYVVGQIGTFPVDFQIRSNPIPAPRQQLYKSGTIASATISPANVDRGNSVTVTLSAAGLKNVFGADIVLTYDKSQLTPVSVTSTGIAVGSMMSSSMKNGTIRLELASANGLNNDGDLFQITFQASEDLRGMIKSPISFAKFDVNEKDVKGLATDGTVEIKGKPVSFALSQNYPNPFNPSTTIKYQVPDDGLHVRILIYNLTGQLVRTLVDQDQRAGEYNALWDGRSDGGQQVSTGIYFARMTAKNFVSVKKMLLVK